MTLGIAFRILLLFAWIWSSHQTDKDITAKEVYSWVFTDFTYQSQNQRAAAIINKQFVPENVIILDSDFILAPNSQEKRFFVTTFAFLEGSPATLSTISKEKNGGSVLLQPFPNWRANDRNSCQSLISVFRIQIDKCGNLWVVDSGVTDIFFAEKHTCPPKLIIYDLKNRDEVLVRHEFSETVLKRATVTANLVIESSKSDCRDSVAYIADIKGNSLLVYDWKENTSWRVDHHRFYPYPDYGVTTTNGVTFNFMDGVFGLALSMSN